MSQQTSSSTDLVFVVTSGQRIGEQISVKTEKCFLGQDPNSKNKRPQVAIYRGPAGATLQNYGDEVLVNGESKSSHWLTVGDQIQFPDQTILKVSQLGQVSADSTLLDHHEEPERYDMPHTQQFDTESADAQQKLSQLESQISEIQEHNELFQGRFNELDQRLSHLTDQLENLVSLASSSAAFRAEPVNSSPNDSHPIVEQQSKMTSSAPVMPRSAETVVDLPAASAAEIAAVLAQNEALTEDQPESTPKPASPPAYQSPTTTSARRGNRYQDDSIASEWAKIESSHPSIETLKQFSLSSDEVTYQQSTDELSDATLNDESEPTVGAHEGSVEQAAEDTLAALNAGESSSTHSAESGCDPNEESFESIMAKLNAGEPNTSPSSDFVNAPAVNRERESLPVAHETTENLDEEVESSTLSAVTTATIDDTTTDDATAVVEPEPVENASRNESVTDLLARMKAEGQWDGDSVYDDDPAIVNETESSMSAVPALAAEPSQPIAAQDNHAAADTDVEDYMSQLLSRMRGGEEPATARAPTPAKIETKNEAPVEAVRPAAPEPAETMKAEEFVPSHKAKKIESLSAMRELANSTARTAVADSEDDRRRALAYVQVAIAVAALIMAVYYFAVHCQAVGDTSFIVGLICLGLTGFLGFRSYQTITSKPQETETD